MLSRSLLFACAAIALAPNASADPAEDASSAREAATRYLAALVGGDASGRDLTFGGKTMSVELEALENFALVGETVKRESGQLADLAKAVRRLDEAGRRGNAKVLAKVQAADDLAVVELTPAEAQAITGATRRESESLLRRFPVFGKIGRVAKPVYWSPANPIRKLIADAGPSGAFSIELYTFDVETKEGPRQVARVWHLKVFRFTGGAVDTGFRVLAAADWGAD